MKTGPAALLLALVACNGDEPTVDGATLLDTGWFVPTGTPLDPDTCLDRVKITHPLDGATNWYWRDRPEVFVESANRTAYPTFLQTLDGVRLATTAVWNEATGASFVVDFEGELEPDTTYVLGVDDCVGPQTVTFTTSDLGRPLEGEPEDLTGNTYLLDLVGATWVQPSALAGVLQQYFNTPILLGVSRATEDYLKFTGAPGETDNLGVVSQDITAPTWDFPHAPFDRAPYIDVFAPEISFLYDEGGTTIDVPVEGFVFRATVSADGTRLGGGELSGLADSRYLAEELLGGDPGDLCVFAAGLGVSCVPCADGQSYCLELVARDLEAELLPGLGLVILE